MAKNLDIQLELTVKDNASKAVNKAAQEVQKGLKGTAQAAEASGKAQEAASQKAGRAAQQQQRVTQQAQNQMRSSSQALARAREALGVRSERVIQREILQSQLAYQRLARSGVASANDLKRAFAAHREQLRGLNAELGKTSMGQKLGSVGKGLMGVTAGVMAGAAVAKPKMMNAADYSLQLAYIADTGYSGKSVEEKQAGKQKIHEAVKKSITQYGGTKEDAVAAISELMSKGKVSVEDALALLPTIQMNATATGASSEDITKLVNSALGAGIKRDEMAAFLDYASASGKAGGFELKDFAQYAPQILSSANSAGLSGMEDMKSLFKYVQQVYNVSGGSSETATNVVNFLSKLKSSDLKKKVEDIEYVDPKDKKTKQIDFTSSMVEYQKQGLNTAEAFMKIVDKVLASDKTYQKMLGELDKAQGEDKRAVAEKIAKYVEGTKVGAIMPDLQAGAALFAIRNDKETAQNVDDQFAIVDKDKGNFNKTSFDYISKENAFKFQVAKNNLEMAEIDNFDKLNDVAGNAAELLSKYAGEYPALTQTLVGAKDAVEILGTAAFAAAGSLALLSGLSGGKFKLPTLFSRGAATTAATKAATGAATSAASGAGRFGVNGVGRFAQGVGKVASRAAGVMMIYDTVQFLGDARTAQQIQEEQKAESAEGQQAEARKAQFYRTISKTTENSPWARAGGLPYTKVDSAKPSVPLYGGYVLADIAQNQQIAEARKTQGLISADRYATRTLRNQALTQDILHPEQRAMLPYQRSPQAGAAPEGNTRELIDGITAPMSQQLLPSFEKMNQSLGEYRTEFGTFGGQMQAVMTSISESMAALLNQKQMIENHISVNLDGRVVAENTSQYLFNYANRGVA